MRDTQWQDLASTVSALAADCVLVQKQLDAAVIRRREAFAALLAAVPQDVQSLLMPLAPAGLTVAEYRIDCTLRVTTARSVSLSLVAAPINVGYHALYGTTAAEQSSVSIEVRAVPSRTVI